MKKAKDNLGYSGACILALVDRLDSRRELTDAELERGEVGALLIAEHLHLIRSFLTKKD